MCIIEYFFVFSNYTSPGRYLPRGGVRVPVRSWSSDKGAVPPFDTQPEVRPAHVGLALADWAVGGVNAADDAHPTYVVVDQRVFARREYRGGTCDEGEQKHSDHEDGTKGFIHGIPLLGDRYRITLHLGCWCVKFF